MKMLQVVAATVMISGTTALVIQQTKPEPTPWWIWEKGDPVPAWRKEQIAVEESGRTLERIKYEDKVYFCESVKSPDGRLWFRVPYEESQLNPKYICEMVGGGTATVQLESWLGNIDDVYSTASEYRKAKQKGPGYVTKERWLKERVRLVHGDSNP